MKCSLLWCLLVAITVEIWKWNPGTNACRSQPKPKPKAMATNDSTPGVEIPRGDTFNNNETWQNASPYNSSYEYENMNDSLVPAVPFDFDQGHPEMYSGILAQQNEDNILNDICRESDSNACWVVQSFSAVATLGLEEDWSYNIELLNRTRRRTIFRSPMIYRAPRLSPRIRPRNNGSPNLRISAHQRNGQSPGRRTGPQGRQRQQSRRPHGQSPGRTSTRRHGAHGAYSQQGARVPDSPGQGGTAAWGDRYFGRGRAWEYVRGNLGRGRVTRRRLHARVWVNHSKWNMCSSHFFNVQYWKCISGPHIDVSIVGGCSRFWRKGASVLLLLGASWKLFEGNVKECSYSTIYLKNV